MFCRRDGRSNSHKYPVPRIQNPSKNKVRRIQVSHIKVCQPDRSPVLGRQVERDPLCITRRFEIVEASEAEAGEVNQVLAIGKVTDEVVPVPRRKDNGIGAVQPVSTVVASQGILIV